MVLPDCSVETAVLLFRQDLSAKVPDISGKMVESTR